MKLFPLNRREAWKAIKEDPELSQLDVNQILIKLLELFGEIYDPFNPKNDDKNHYNVYIYQILPNPPNTKEPHNHSKLN